MPSNSSSSHDDESIPSNDPFTTVQIPLPSPNSAAPELSPIETRLANFTPPAGYEVVSAPKQTKSRSVIYNYGVRVNGVGQNKGKRQWYCCATDACREIIRVKQSTSNASDHLQKVHGIVSRRSGMVMNSHGAAKTRILREKLSILNMDAQKYHHINIVKLIIKKMLPFNFSESTEFRVLLQMLDQRKELKTPLHAKTVKMIILELYLATLSTIKSDIEVVFNASAVPCLHLNLDLWTSRTSHDKYVGVRIFFITTSWELRSHLLGIRIFRASPTVSEQRMSDLLKLWCGKVLSEFGASSDNLYSSTSDAGSDVKRLCCKLLTSKWDWCISHMCNCALVEAFGTCLQKTSCKNMPFRNLLKKLKSVIEHLHKSQPMRAKFEDLQFEEVGSRLKLVKDMPHRWLGTIRLLDRFLSLWKVLRKHYYQTEETAFPVDEDLPIFVECFSLAKPVGEIITLAQASDYPAGIDAFLALCRLRKTVLSPSSPLPIYDPSSDNYDSGSPSSFRHTVALQDLTISTRSLLSSAFEKRFFSGYNGTPRSLILEMQVFLHPAYPSLRCLDHILDQSSAISRREEIRVEIVQLAYTVAQAEM